MCCELNYWAGLHISLVCKELQAIPDVSFRCPDGPAKTITPLKKI